MAIRSSIGFSHLWPGVFHIPLPTHKIHNREGGEKKEIQTWTWVSTKRKRGKVCDTFLAFCVLWANTSVYLSEIPTKPRGMLTHFLALVNRASAHKFLQPPFWLLLTALFSALLSSADCLLLFCWLAEEKCLSSHSLLALWAGVVKYTDCRGVRLPLKIILFMTLNHLMMRLLPRGFGHYGLPFIAFAPRCGSTWYFSVVGSNSTNCVQTNDWCLIVTVI